MVSGFWSVPVGSGPGRFLFFLGWTRLDSSGHQACEAGMRDTSHRLKRVYSFAARHSSAPALRTRATTFASEQLRLFDAIDSPTILRFYVRDFTFERIGRIDDRIDRPGRGERGAAISKRETSSASHARNDAETMRSRKARDDPAYARLVVVVVVVVVVVNLESRDRFASI